MIINTCLSLRLVSSLGSKCGIVCWYQSNTTFTRRIAHRYEAHFTSLKFQHRFSKEIECLQSENILNPRQEHNLLSKIFIHLSLVVETPYFQSFESIFSKKSTTTFVRIFIISSPFSTVANLGAPVEPVLVSSLNFQ